jgi:hypothetical protein
MLATISNFQTPEKIAQKLFLSKEVVLKVLKDLEKMQLVQLKEGKWRTTLSSIHLAKTSPYITSHHVHIRNRTIARLQNQDLSGMHYSSYMTMAYSDIEKVKNILLEALGKIKEVVDHSQKEEELCCFSLDFFNL